MSDPSARPSNTTLHPVAPLLTSVPSLHGNEGDSYALIAVVVAVLLPRLLLFPWSENLYGDAVIRTELAQRWADHPHWISSFADGAYQFGPLHLYLVGAVLKLGVARAWAGRWVSLVFGVLSVFPLYLLTRRLFGVRAAVVAGLSFAAWGMHIQMSTTGGSEALGLFLMLWVLELVAQGLETNLFSRLALAALCLNLACATRYDAWMLVPLLVFLLFRADKDWVAGLTRAVFFGLLCVPFPLLWMQGNELAKGSAFYPVYFIEAFHRGWVQEGITRWGNVGYRLQNLLFWPGAALLTLSPGVALFGASGMRRAFRERPEARLLLWVAWVPTVYFTFKAAVLMSFVPLARFAVNQLVLLLPFVAYGFDGLLGKWPPRARASVWTLTALLAVTVPTVVAVRSYHQEDGLASSLRPVSPLSANPAAVMQVADFLKNTALPTGDAAVVDTDPNYWDLQVAFFSGLPEMRLARYRWDTFEKRLKENHPRYLVRMDHGTLDSSGELKSAPGGVVFRGERFAELPGFGEPFHVYRRD